MCWSQIQIIFFRGSIISYVSLVRIELCERSVCGEGCVALLSSHAFDAICHSWVITIVIHWWYGAIAVPESSADSIWSARTALGLNYIKSQGRDPPKCLLMRHVLSLQHNIFHDGFTRQTQATLHVRAPDNMKLRLIFCRVAWSISNTAKNVWINLQHWWRRAFVFPLGF